MNMDKQELSTLGGAKALDAAYLDFASSGEGDFLQVVDQRIAHLSRELGKPDLHDIGLAPEDIGQDPSGVASHGQEPDL